MIIRLETAPIARDQVTEDRHVIMIAVINGEHINLLASQPGPKDMEIHLQNAVLRFPGWLDRFILVTEHSVQMRVRRVGATNQMIEVGRITK